MPLRRRRLKAANYEALQEQLATAAALCSDEQVLDLADGLHDTLRRRRRSEYASHQAAREDGGPALN